MGPIEFQSRPNLAFETIFQDILSCNVTTGDEVTRLQKDTISSDFPINLTLPFNASTKINTLQEAHSIFTKCWDKKMSKNNSDVSYILTDHYQKQISQIRELIDENHKEQFLASHYSEIFATTALATTLVNMFLLFKIFKDHRKLKVLMATLSMIKSNSCLSLTVPDPSHLPSPTSSPQVICYAPVVLWTFNIPFHHLSGNNYIPELERPKFMSGIPIQQHHTDQINCWNDHTLHPLQTQKSNWSTPEDVY